MKYLVRVVPAKLLYKCVIKEKYDTEVAFLENISTKIISGSKSESKKIAWVHVDIQKHYSTRKLFLTKRRLVKAYSKMNQIVCVSQEVKNKFKEYTKLEKNVITIYNPINQEEIIKKSKEKVEKIFHNSNFTIGTIGRLTWQKGYKRLVKVVKEIIKENKIKINLMIVGEGEEHEKLQKYIDNNKLGEYIKLIGFVENPYAYIKQSNLFISSSIVEGFSLALAEAITLDIPVISTSTAGPNEILEKGHYRLIVENTTKSKKKGILELVKNHNKYLDLKEKVKKRKNFFQLEKTIQEIQKIL